MSTHSRALALVVLLVLIATAAKSDGIGSFTQGVGIFGGIGGSTGISAGPPVSGALLLEDGSSILLLEDGSSSLCLEGGC